MKTLKRTGIVIVVLSVLLISCKKTTNNPPAYQNNSTQNNPNPVATATGFTWQENNGPLITADSAYWKGSTSGWIVVWAFKGNDHIELGVNPNLAPADQHLDPVGMGFFYYKSGDEYQISWDTYYTGSISNNLVSGNFDFHVSNNAGVAIQSVKASFTNIPYHP